MRWMEAKFEEECPKVGKFRKRIAFKNCGEMTELNVNAPSSKAILRKPQHFGRE